MRPNVVASLELTRLDFAMVILIVLSEKTKWDAMVRILISTLGGLFRDKKSTLVNIPFYFNSQVVVTVLLAVAIIMRCRALVSPKNRDAIIS